MTKTTFEVCEKKALPAREACESRGLNPRTMANLRSQKKGCRYYKRGRKVFYRPEDLDAWLFANPVQTIASVEK